MFIIFGMRTRPSKVSEGDFFCPRCGADRHYVLQRFRQWFTLFFLPIFPMGASKGEQVKCQTCGTAYRPEVLRTPTSAALASTIRDTMRSAAVAMLKAGDVWDVSARQAAVDTIVSTGGGAYGETELSEDLFALDATQLPAQLGLLARGLSEQGKETFITRLAQIAAADGPVTEGEKSVLDNVGAALGLSAAHVLGVMTAVDNADRPYS